MLLDIMGPQINVRVKDDKLFFQAGLFRTKVMVGAKVVFETRVVLVVHVQDSAPFAKEARLVGLPTVLKELVFRVKV
jgi:hypothetical protein